MNAYQQNVDGCESLAMDYPKSDNNGSLSDASTIPKDGDHLQEGSEVAAERNQNENPKLDRALTVLKEYCAIGRGSKLAEDAVSNMTRSLKRHLSWRLLMANILELYSQ